MGKFWSSGLWILCLALVMWEVPGQSWMLARPTGLRVRYFTR